MVLTESPRWWFLRESSVVKKRQKGEKVDFSTFSAFLAILADPSEVSLLTVKEAGFCQKWSKCVE